MILDSGLNNISKNYHDKTYLPMLESIASIGNVGYYMRGTPKNSLNKVIDIGFAGIGIDSSVDLNNALKKATGYVQGNFDETLLLQDNETILKYEIQKWLDTIEDPRGWVCGLGHGITKTTPTSNVKLFVEMVRNHYS